MHIRTQSRYFCGVLTTSASVPHVPEPGLVARPARRHQARAMVALTPPTGGQPPPVVEPELVSFCMRNDIGVLCQLFDLALVHTPQNNGRMLWFFPALHSLS